MNLAQTNRGVVRQLENALVTGSIPDEGKRRAAQLLSRLKSPVQVVVIGYPGAGKSRLINMLLNESVIPDTANLPPVEVAFSPHPATIHLKTDGSQETLEGLQLDRPPAPDTAILRAQLPLAILNRLNLTELNLTGSAEEQKAIADWAMARADIVLWCSQSFGTDEQLLWASAPDALKDHSFLVLTKADQLQMKGVLDDHITRLEDIVSEEFYRMFPVATIQAISSRGSDETTWSSSGGKALNEAILRLVDTGQAADTDNALMFLNRHATHIPDTGHHDTPPPQADGERTSPIGAPPESTRTRPGDNPDIDTRVLARALDFMRERADLMLGIVAGERPDKQAVILDHCLETADRLCEIMTEIEQATPPLSHIQEDIQECSDMMVLFHLEKTEDAAADAVTLLLQMKKEISAATAG